MQVTPEPTWRINLDEGVSLGDLYEELGNYEPDAFAQIVGGTLLITGQRYET